MQDVRKLLYSLNPWWTEQPYRAEGLFAREAYLRTIKDFLKIPHVVVLAGSRRAGKTSILKILIEDLLKNTKRDAFDVLYLSFDDPLLSTLISEKNILDTILEEYELIRKKPIDKKVIIVIDEVQALPEWPVWLKKYYDQKQYKFIVSGSSVSLLKGKFTELTGRSVNMEISPFDFKEIAEMRLGKSIGALKNLTFEAIEALQNEVLPYEKKIKIYFEEYKEKGGFPEVVNEQDEEIWKTILKNYFDQILYRDIVRAYRIKEVGVLENLTLYLMQNISQKFSYHNIAKSIEANVEITRTFLGYLADGYLFSVVAYYGGSLKTTLKKMKKIYMLDVGLRHSLVGHKGLDDGMIIENIVFNALRKNFEKIYYWYDRNKHEVDFVARLGVSFYALEVKYADYKLQAKDLKGLLSFLDKKQLDTGFVITRDTFEKREVEGKTLIFIPTWLFCLIDLKNSANKK